MIADQRRWERFTPQQRLARFATYLLAVAAVVASVQTIEIIPEFGGLEVTTSSTNLQSLTDAFLYLVKYPFECAEQRASRILAIAALRDVLDAFKVPDMPSKAALEKSVAEDLERIAEMQNWDGGFAFWDRGYPSIPYLTVHVANALARAKDKGMPDEGALVAFGTGRASWQLSRGDWNDAVENNCQ